LYEKS
jgi:hypothetical protein